MICFCSNHPPSRSIPEGTSAIERITDRWVLRAQSSHFQVCLGRMTYIFNIPFLRGLIGVSSSAIEQELSHGFSAVFEHTRITSKEVVWLEKFSPEY